MGLELKKVQFSQENKQLSFWKKKQTCLIYSHSEKSSSVFEGKLLESFFFFFRVLQNIIVIWHTH